MPRLHQGLGNRDQGGLSVLKRRIEVRWTRQVQNDNVMYISVMPYRHGILLLLTSGQILSLQPLYSNKVKKIQPV
jgi:hypothetical protein